ncbi:MAG: hypothetical protein AAF223_04695 [Bacteroidota bacterium]
MAAKIKADFEDISVTVNEIEQIRRQLLDMKPMLTGSASEVKEMFTTVDSTILELENEIIQLKTTGFGQDGVRFPGKLMKKLSYLSSAVATGDFSPPNQHQEVYEELHARWEDVEGRWNTYKEGSLNELITKLQENQIGPLVSQ